MDTKKITNFGLFTFAFLLFWALAQAFELMFTLLDLRIETSFYVTIPQLIALVIAGGLLGLALKSQGLNGYLHEAVLELTKVVYPTPKESGQSALVVIAIVALATLVLMIFDSIWSAFTKFILTN